MGEKEKVRREPKASLSNPDLRAFDIKRIICVLPAHWLLLMMAWMKWPFWALSKGSTVMRLDYTAVKTRLSSYMPMSMYV